MDRMKNILFLLMFSVAFSALFSVSARAEERTEFRVQTETQPDDGEIEVTIYIDNAEHIGGADLELRYDPEQVSYVDGGIGDNVSAAYYDVYHNQDSQLIKYVLLLPVVQNEDEAFLKAVFKLTDTESYQPDFRVKELVDDSDAIEDVDYTVLYQQADGTWAESANPSAEQETETDEKSESVDYETNVAPDNTRSEEVSEDLQNAEASDSLQNTKIPENPTGSVESQNTESEKVSRNEKPTAEKAEPEAEKITDGDAEGKAEPNTEPEEQEAEKAASAYRLGIGILLILVGIAIAAFVIWKQRKKNITEDTGRKEP